MKAVATFWEARKKDDPARLADDARMKLQQLHDLLSGSQYNVNLPAVDAAAKAVGAACGACHVKYRDQDPATKAYTIKAGTL
jgi:cytochrome c556